MTQLSSVKLFRKMETETFWFWTVCSVSYGYVQVQISASFANFKNETRSSPEIFQKYYHCGWKLIKSLSYFSVARLEDDSVFDIDLSGWTYVYLVVISVLFRASSHSNETRSHTRREPNGLSTPILFLPCFAGFSFLDAALHASPLGRAIARTMNGWVTKMPFWAPQVDWNYALLYWMQRATWFVHWLTPSYFYTAEEIVVLLDVSQFFIYCNRPCQLY